MLKKTISILLVLALFLCALPVSVSAEPGVSARAAVLINADTGEILYAKNENERHSMASTTKIMTALLTLEAAAAEDYEVKITREMVAVEGSSMGLLPDNVVTLRTLACGMLMRSGNDAANAAAISLAGSLDAFARQMNEKAAQIGMENTNFVTPSGLDAEEHYSTAYDMALLGAYAMENADFAEIVGQKSIQVEFVEPPQRITMANHNRLLSLYPDCTGIKTGFTKKSGRCLVSSAERDGVRLVAVTLNAPDDWNDHQALYEYGFSLVTPVKFEDTTRRYTLPVAGGVADSVQVAGKRDASFSVRTEDREKLETRVELPAFVYAPVRAGQPVGKISYCVGDRVVATTDLVTLEETEHLYVEKSFFQKAWDYIRKLFR